MSRDRGRAAEVRDSVSPAVRTEHARTTLDHPILDRPRDIALDGQQCFRRLHTPRGVDRFENTRSNVCPSYPHAERVKVFARIRPPLRDDETPGALAWDESTGALTLFRP